MRKNSFCSSSPTKSLLSTPLGPGLNFALLLELAYGRYLTISEFYAFVGWRAICPDTINMFDTSLRSDWLKLRFGSSLGIRIPEMVFDMFDDRQTLSAYVLKIRFCYCSLRKHPFLLAVRRWGRFARRNVCDSAT